MKQKVDIAVVGTNTNGQKSGRAPLSESGGSASVHLDRIQKSYGALDVLQGLDLAVPKGAVYGFLGRNGAGKSTALRIVMGVTKPSAGRVLLFGEHRDRNLIVQRRRIGYVAQEQNFYGWMTPAKLGKFVSAFYPTWQSARFESLLRRLQLPERKLQSFSGGMKVKVALALALAHAPELLVLDEPMAGLDPVARREFLELVEELVLDRQRTVLFSSHLVDEVEQLSDRIGILEQGRMRFEGPTVELRGRTIFAFVPLGGSPDAFADRGQRASYAQRLAPTTVQILHAKRVEERLRLTLWAESNPEALVEAKQLLPEAHFEPPSLEEVFIALVRSNSSGLARD